MSLPVNNPPNKQFYTVLPEKSDKNELYRILYGKPGRPQEATKEMVEVADKVVRALVANGELHGWYKDTSEEFIGDKTNEMLNNFVAFSKKGERIPHMIVVDTCTKLRKKTDLKLDTVQKYANLQGYQCQWLGQYLNKISTIAHK